MPIYEKFEMPFNSKFRDVRPTGQRLTETFSAPSTLANIFFGVAMALIVLPASGATFILAWIDVIFIFALLYLKWFNSQSFKLPFKLPAYAQMKDPKNPVPGKDGGAGWSEGILFLGNERDPKTGKELWLTNSDARTHILFLGTTGTGKTEGLKSIVSNSLIWGSGFIYVDGKADTELWANLYSLARRFGRDDDLLVINYMTGNTDDGSMSNTFNPFSTGSASYLSNMLTNLMPDAGGDNAMWKERAVALMFSLMPALTFKRDKQGLLLDISIVRDNIELKPIVRLSRDSTLPERIIRGLQGYLSTLPGYVDDAFDDDGNEKPPSPDAPMYDLQIARQQHGYLSMQFTRALQSLGDEYSYIFRAQLADIDVLDVVLNRRIMIGLIPILEKSMDEAANLGKIIAATIRGMMGATLGSTVEGTWEDTIESKATRAPSPYMTVFDEVGYYTAQGMAAMAAQARSLGFSLVFASQDLPAMEKRVKQEAQSIVGNCNLKIFGKLEDPLESKKFFEEHVGTSWVYETQGFNAPTNLLSSFFVNTPYIDNRSSTTVVLRPRAAYDHLRKQREGQVHMLFHEFLVVAQLYHAQPKRVTALRVQKLLPVPPTTTSTAARERMITDLARKLEDNEWSAAKSGSPAQVPQEVKVLAEGFKNAENAKVDPVRAGIAALAGIFDLAQKAQDESKTEGGSVSGRVVMDEDANEGEQEPARAPTAPSRRGPPVQQRAVEAEAPETEVITESGSGSESAAPSGFGESFDYRPRAATRLNKIGVGMEDIAAIKPQDVSVLPQDAETGKLKDLPPEAVATLQKGAEHLSKALFSETREGAE